MDLPTLRRNFNLPGITFDELNNLQRLHLDTPTARATLYLQGAHLTHWQPAGFDPAILLSHKTTLAPGKPIRGGIPIVFPWFAGDTNPHRIDGHPGPTHGFARIQDWQLDAIHPTPDATHLTFTLGPTALSCSMGYDHFLLTLQFQIGRDLDMQLTVANTGDTQLNYEQAFHTYYKVADIHEVAISGLEPTPFIDKTDNMQLKPAAHAPIRFTETLDRVYNNTAAPILIEDIAGRRRITLHKSGSNSTIVWNPWSELPDLGPWDWHEMVAVETANVGPNALTLPPGAHATMQSHITLAAHSPRDKA